MLRALILPLLIGGPLIPAAAADEKPQRVGVVPFDGYEAVVTFTDWTDCCELYGVTVAISRPAADPPIDGKRLRVWLLGAGDPEHPAFARHYACPGRLVETPDGDRVVAKVAHRFDPRSGGGRPAGIVVAVDGVPRAFPIPRDLGGIDPKTVAAWERAGADLIWADMQEERPWFARYARRGPGAMPAFSTLRLRPKAGGLPIPDAPFGLSLGPKTGSLADLPGRDQARTLWLHLESLSRTDRDILARLTHLEVLSLHGGLGDAEVKAAAGLARLERLSLWNSAATDDALADVARLSRLRVLGLGRTGISGKGLARLAALRELRTLDLSETKVTDTDLEALAGLTNLEALNLNRTNVTGTGLKHLAGLPRLRALGLSTSRLTADGLTELGRLTQLTSLNLSRAPIAGDAWKPLAGLTRLEALDLSDSKIDDAGLRALAPLTRLKVLRLSNTAIGDAGLTALAGMKDLEELELADTKAGDAGCRVLAGLAKLRDLGLYETQVGDAGVQALTRLTELRRLNLRYLKLTDPTLKALAGLTNLELLDLGDTEGVTTTGVDELRKSLPATHIPR